MQENRHKDVDRRFAEAPGAEEARPSRVFTGRDASVMDFGDELPDPPASAPADAGPERRKDPDVSNTD